MKKIYTICIILLVVTVQQLSAQCSTCTPVFSNCSPGGGLCTKFDTAYASNNFDQSLNFYMPTVLTNAAVLAQCSCSQVDLQSITITGVSGLPVGMTYSLSNGGQYNVVGGDTTGCVHFCGTPLVAGSYPVTVNLSADVIAIGTPIGNVTQNNVPQQYNDTLIVLPDTVPGVSSFTYGNNGSIACDSITVTLSGVLSAPLPNLTSYSWQLPGGQTSTQKSPGSFTFINTSNVPDTFPITLTTVFYNYVITEVYITHISGGYCGDVEEVDCNCLGFWDSPDPYLIIPALGFNNSANYVSNQCTDVDFAGLAINMPEGTHSVNLEIWDKDVISSDDSLGTFLINAALGTQNYSGTNAYGWVTIDTVPGTIVSETLNVIVNPVPPTPVVTASQDTFCTNDSVLISASTGPYSYRWFQDTAALNNETASSFYTTNQGLYKVIVTDQNTGCTSKPSSYTNVVSEATPLSPISIVHVGSQLYVTPFTSGLKVHWYYNGNQVAGQSGAVIPNLGNGIYSAEVYNSAFPACNVIATPDTLVSGINETYITDFNLSIMPNPNNGNFKVQFYIEQGLNVDLNIRSMLGQVVYNRRVENFSGKFDEEINLDGLDKGIYVVSVETPMGRQFREAVVQ